VRSCKLHTTENVSHLNNVKHLNTEEHDQLSKAFKQLFTSYTKAINKQENRHGSLFEKPFKRIEITSVSYLSNLVF
jgi:putative transposase